MTMIVVVPVADVIIFMHFTFMEMMHANKMLSWFSHYIFLFLKMLQFLCSGSLMLLMY